MTRTLLLFFISIIAAGPASAGCWVSPFMSSGYEQDGKDVLIQGAQAYFDTSSLAPGNPPSCRCFYEAIACRSDGLPVTEFHVEVVEKVGIGSSVNSYRSGNCVRHSLTLGVDHSGINGRVCMASVARITLRTIFSVAPLTLPPASPPNPRDGFDPTR